MLSAAFNSKLKELAINEFPCGDGKWVFLLWLFHLRAFSFVGNFLL